MTDEIKKLKKAIGLLSKNLKDTIAVVSYQSNQIESMERLLVHHSQTTTRSDYIELNHKIFYLEEHLRNVSYNHVLHKFNSTLVQLYNHKKEKEGEG